MTRLERWNIQVPDVAGGELIPSQMLLKCLPKADKKQALTSVSREIQDLFRVSR